MGCAVCLVLSALLACAAAGAVRSYSTQTKDADAEFLQREMGILQLLSHIYQPLMIDSKTAEMAKALKPAEFYQPSKEELMDHAKEMFHYLSVDRLHKEDDVFEPMKNEHFKQAKALYELLRWAKDYDVFYKTALWARENLNERLFIFALSSAIREREDTKNIILPPLSEVIPNMFIRSETMQKAYEVRMRSLKSENDIFAISSNFSMTYHPKMRPEMRLAYFTEDIALNEWNYEMNIGWPKLMNMNVAEDKGFYSEMIYFNQRQLLARYRLERLANNVEDLKKFMVEDKEMIGFVPHLHYRNGKAMPMRPEMKVQETENMMKQNVKMLEERFKKLIDEGVMIENKMETLSGKKGMNVLVSLMNADHHTASWPHFVVPKHFDSIMNKMMLLAHYSVDPKMSLDLAPSALLQFETQLRDPLYYSILLRIHDLFMRYKSESYNKHALSFPGVKVETLKFDKLLTYFENFDTELNSGLDIASSETDKKMRVVARTSRLNHKPFSYQAIISSEKDVSAAVRVFIGPKYDANGIEMSMLEKAPMMMEMDRFVVEMTVGKNKVERNSQDFPLFRQEKDGFRTLYKKIDDAINKKAPFQIDEDQQRLLMPAHLLLPKGKKAGMAYSVFMVVTPLKDSSNKTDKIMIDDCPLGFPFDYKMDYSEWVDRSSAEKALHSNMMDTEVFIYHKKTDEMHEPQ